MTYSPSKFQLSHLLQGAWQRMGQLKMWTATGGSTSTVIDSDWAIPEEPVFEDDDPSLIFGTVVVVRDAGGAGAAPEGEFGMITDYDSSTNTLTMDAISSAVASGDKIGIASPLFPLDDMLGLANLALRKLGDLDLVDTSITVVGNQTEYTLPTTIRMRPIEVRMQSNVNTVNNQWELVQGWRVIPATAGSNWTLVTPTLNQGWTLQIVYRAPHPILSAFADDIIETVHPELAICALCAEAYQWYNNNLGGSNQYMLQRENKAITDLEAAKVLYPIRHFVGQVQGLPHWNVNQQYVPLTSDLKA